MFDMYDIDDFVYLGTVEGGCVWRRFCIRNQIPNFHVAG
jgi:hypothetical protein